MGAGAGPGASQGAYTDVAPNEEDTLLPTSSGGARRASSTKHTIYATLAIFAVAAALFVGMSWYVVDPSSAPEPSTGGRSGVTVEAVLDHLKKFEEIAGRHPNNSRSILNNYEASALYVESLLNASDGYFNVTRQYFSAPVWEMKGTPVLDVYAPDLGTYLVLDGGEPLGGCQGAEFVPMRYSGVTDGPVELIAFNAADGGVQGNGCAASQYTPPGNGVAWAAVATDGGGCTVYEKALAAEEAGAGALIVHRVAPSDLVPGGRVRDAWWTPASKTITIPVLGASNTAGKILVNNVKIKVGVEADYEVAWTFNVLAETNAGNANATVVVGAHLDSVPEGPGINDNGSGSAGILEMALQSLRGRAQHKNKVVFAWFGAEEIGLLGSRYYVREFLQNGTSPTGYKVAANLNFDMLGSPNYKRIVYAADSCPEETRRGCGALQRRFTEYFHGNGLAYELSNFSTTGGSDYFPFIYTGIPAGSIATGAGGIKTAEERATYGGIANTKYDSCYHNACDSLDNVNALALAEMVGAADHVFRQIAELDNPAS